MKEIAIVSGKGGTGKTSVAASLALVAGMEAVIADCDVDAANMHLLLRPDFSEACDFYSGEIAVIDKGMCRVCGKCMEVCHFDAVTLTDSYAEISAINCEGCGYCSYVCGSSAITMVPAKTGVVYESNIRSGSKMVHATMEPGAENSGKLVFNVRERAADIARREQKGFTIIDGSPGIGCPVIASLSGVSLAVLVTEPSVAAIHDLLRIVEVIQQFRIRTLCVINKYDINRAKTNEIKLLLANMNIAHVCDIAYDSDIAKAIAAGKAMSESGKRGSRAIAELWSKIKAVYG